MSEDDADRYRDRLLIEIVAEWLRFDSLAERLPGPTVYPPYLLTVTILFIQYGVLELYNFYVTGKNSFVASPSSLALPAMTLLAVFGARYMHDTYADAVSRLQLLDRPADSDPSTFEDLVSFRVRVAVYVVALIAQKASAIFLFGLGTLVEVDGIALVAFEQAVVFPLVVVPALVELGLAYLSVHVAVPLKIQQANLNLFFHDPLNMGGFGPIGELLKRSYYLYTAVLLLYFVQTQAPVLLSEYFALPYGQPDPPVIELALSLAWVFGILTIGYSMYRIHSIMKREKRDRIRELEADLRATMDQPFDIAAAAITDQTRYDETQEHLQQVRDTKTYPTTFTMWSQILISVILPQALNMIV